MAAPVFLWSLVIRDFTDASGENFNRDEPLNKS